MDILEKLNTIVKTNVGLQLNERLQQIQFPKETRILTKEGDVSPTISPEQTIEYISRLSRKVSDKTGVQRLITLMRKISNVEDTSKESYHSLALYLIAKQLQLSVLSASRGITLERIFAGMTGAAKLEYTGPSGGSVDFVYNKNEFYSVKSTVKTKKININSIVIDYTNLKSCQELVNEYNKYKQQNINNVNFDEFLSLIKSNPSKKDIEFKNVLENFYVIYAKLSATEAEISLSITNKGAIKNLIQRNIQNLKDNYNLEDLLPYSTIVVEELNIDKELERMKKAIDSNNKLNVKMIYEALKLAQQIDEETQDIFSGPRQNNAGIDKTKLSGQFNTIDKTKMLGNILSKLRK